ncbi:chromate transporter [Paludibacterium yongneupense]|uniref:chromate transporter n=1 Tax=Paludibacterium yongneupense TaxID=400061 RepID=UPI00041184A5|nr:chromate transporter [Paludibacterium yongneupense]
MIPPLIHPGRRALFAGFFKVGITAFGGVLPLVRRMMVDERRWVDDHDFTELLGLGQALPGPNVMNIAIAIGMRFQGISGAISAVAGLMLAPMTIILTLAVLYDRFAYSPALKSTLAGLASVAAGLMVAMGIRLGLRMRRRHWRYLVAAATFIAVAVLRLPLIVVLAAMAPLAVFCAWREMGAEA